MTEQSAAPAPELAPLPARRVAVWPHTLGEFEHFDNAIAVMSANGALVVWRWGEPTRQGAVPLKMYAPGAWVTVEHLGEGYALPPQPELPPRSRGYSDRHKERMAEERRAAAQQHEDDEPAPRSRANDPDPFAQLAPEALNAEAVRQGHRRLRTTRYAEQEANSPVFGPDQVVELGEDGDDEAFRRSGDHRPLAEEDDESDDTGQGGVAQSVQRALAPIGQRLRKSARSLWQGFSTLDPLSPVHPHLPQLPPRWYTSSPVLTALVISLTPVMLYLSISGNTTN